MTEEYSLNYLIFKTTSKSYSFKRPFKNHTKVGLHTGMITKLSEDNIQYCKEKSCLNPSKVIPSNL